MPEIDVKPVEKTTLYEVIGKDAEYFTKDVSRELNYTLRDGRDIGAARVETWGGNGPDFKNIRTYSVDKETGDEYHTLALNYSDINLMVKVTPDKSQEITVNLANPLKSDIQGYDSAKLAWRLSGHDMWKIHNGVDRQITINAQGVKTADTITAL